MDAIVTAKQLGEYLKLSESTIYKLTAQGNLPGFKIGDSWRFDMQQILKLIDTQKSLTRAQVSKKKKGDRRE